MSDVNLSPLHVTRKLRRDLHTLHPLYLYRYIATLARIVRVSRGEFYVPKRWAERSHLYRDLQNVVHLARYEWVARCVTAADLGQLADISCGCGYGSYLLRQVAHKVYGADHSAAALAYAQTHYAQAGLSFLRHDLDSPEKLPIRGKLDAVISFETIEHTRTDRWLDKFRSLLCPGGVLVVSTQLAPGDTRLTDGNPHHPRLYTRSEFEGMLGQLGTVTRGEALPLPRTLDQASSLLRHCIDLKDSVFVCTLT